EQLLKSVTEQLSKEGDDQFYEASLGHLLSEGLSMDQIALGLIKLQLGSSVQEFSEQNFALDLGRGGERGSDRSRSGRDRDRDRGDRGGRAIRGRERSERGDRSDRGRGRVVRDKNFREPNMARLFLNLGRKDQIRPNDIVGAIAGETGIPGREIGGIDIFDNFSFVDVPSKDAAHVIDVMNTNTIKGKVVNIELSKG